jgi:hypothetical protein
MTDPCPAPEALARAVSGGAPEAMTEHVASCAACGLEWESAKRLRSLAGALPFDGPEPERVAAVRSRVVERAIAARRLAAARLALYPLLAVAAAAVFAIGLRGFARAPIRMEPAPRYHGTVVATPSAHWSRASAAPDEVVVLEAGTIHVEVTPLGPGERFRVRAGDGEVEVRGTAFDVDVEAGHLTRVAVDHGRVEVRGVGAPAAILGAGERWRAEEAKPHDVAQPPPSQSAEVPPAPVPVVSSSSHPKAAGPKAAESASPPVEAPAIAERTAVMPEPPPPAATRPASPTAPAAREAAPVPSQLTAAPASGGERDREEQRRERRDERRERHDQRRLR